MWLWRAQKGNVETPFDFRVVDGQHGKGIYAFQFGKMSMAKYYTQNGESLFQFSVPDALIMNLHRKRYDYWQAMYYMDANPDKKVFSFKHKGIGIPTGIEFVITDPSIIHGILKIK